MTKIKFLWVNKSLNVKWDIFVFFKTLWIQVNFEFLEFWRGRQKPEFWQIFLLLFADSFMQNFFQPFSHSNHLFWFSECGFSSNGFTFYGIEVCKIIEKNTSSWIMGYQFFWRRRRRFSWLSFLKSRDGKKPRFWSSRLSLCDNSFCRQKVGKIVRDR